MKRIAWLAVVAVLVSACADGSQRVLGLDDAAGPSLSATTSTQNFFEPIDLLVFVPCAADGAGELVALSGQLHVLLHTTINGNNFRVRSHFQPQGVSGEGLATGARYQGTGVTQETFGGSFVNGRFNATLVNNFRVIGQGSGNNFLVHQNIHITVNANGELTTVVDNFHADCR